MPANVEKRLETPGFGHPTGSALYLLAMSVPYLLTASMVALAIYLRFRPEPIAVSREDGLVEWATCACFLLCALVSGLAAWTKRGALRRRQVILLLVVCGLSLMAVGEELSWGQRWWGFEPPESMRSGQGGMVQMGHNDVTWHNLSFELGPLKFSLGGMLFGVPMVLVLGAYGIWLPLALKKGSYRARMIVHRLGLFVPPLHLGVLMTVGAAVFHTDELWPGIESRELKELLIPMVVLFVLLHAYFSRRRALDRLVTIASLVLLAGGLAVSVYLAGR